MAAITITEILGGDNIAGSRLTINDNFKKLANGINTIETYVNTSPAGGQISIGDLQIRIGSNTIGSTLFRCDASGLVAGNFNVNQNVVVGQSISASLDLTVSRSVTFNGAATGTGTFTSNIPAKFNNQFGSTQFYSSSALDIQSLTQTGNTTRQIPSGTITGKRVLRIDLSQYNSALTAKNCNTVLLPSVGTDNQGQILTIIVSSISPLAMTNFTIGTTNFAPGLTTGIVFSTPTSTQIYSRAVTVFGDSAGWRILSSSNVTIS